MLRACGEALLVPGYAEDGGEEAEIAGVYLVDRQGRPHRIGMAAGNEFSDHTFEKAQLPESCRLEAAHVRAWARSW